MIAHWLSGLVCTRYCRTHIVITPVAGHRKYVTALPSPSLQVSVDPVQGSDLNCMESADVPCATLAGAIRYYGASSHGAFVKDDRARGTYLIVPPPPSSGYEVREQCRTPHVPALSTLLV